MMPRFPFCRGIRASRTFKASKGDRAVLLRIARRFWEEQNFRDFQLDDEMLTARRGSWIGNFTSFDMADLRARLSVCVDDEGNVLCELLINGSGQIITLRDRAYLAFELARFETLLREGRENAAPGHEFQRIWKKDAMKGMFSLGARRQDLDERALERLANVGARLEEVQPFPEARRV